MRFNGQRLKIPLSNTLDNIQDQLSVETFVFLNPQNTENLQDVGGALVKRKDSFTLKLSRGRLKPVFILYTLDVNNQVVETKVKGNVAIPLATWVHIAGIYDGQSVKIFANGTLLAEKPLTGNVVINATEHTFLGNVALTGNLEETRISNIARVGCAPGGIINKDVLRSFYYSGWRVIEERQQEAEVGQPLGQELVSRQFVDGRSIDEHLQMVVYEETGTTVAEEKYLHQNHRGDVVGVTDIGGNVVYRFEYSTYGEIFEVNSDNELDEFTDFEEIVYGFQGRRLDQETSLMYFRNRYYNPELGRFIQRDPKGYIDSYGLYEALGGNPFNYSDPFGKEDSWLGSLWNGVKTATSFVGRTLLGAGAAPTAYVMDSLGFKESAELVYDNLTIRSEIEAVANSEYVAYMANYFNDEQANAINATFTTAGSAWGAGGAGGISVGGAGPTGGVSLALSGVCN